MNNLYSWLPYTNLEFATKKEKFVQIAYGCYPKEWNFTPQKLTSNIVTALKLGSGFLHLVAFIKDNGNPIICEFAWRTPGEHMLSNYSNVYGISIPDLLADGLLGQEIPILEETESIVADIFLPVKEGIVSSITTYRRNEDKNGYFRW